MRILTTGRRIEHAVKSELERHGYVVLGAGSNEPADLIAVKNGVVCVHVKRGSSTLKPDERRRLLALADAVGYGLGLPVIAWKPLRNPSPGASSPAPARRSGCPGIRTQK